MRKIKEKDLVKNKRQIDMELQKDKWINEVMHSSDGMQRAPFRDQTEEIMDRIGRDKKHILEANQNNSFIWQIAATVLILLMLNVISIYSYQSHMEKIHKDDELNIAGSILGIGSITNDDPGSAIFGH